MANGKDNKFDLDSALVRKLARLLQETGLSEIEYAEGDKRIRCASHTGVAAPITHAAPVGLPVAASMPAEAKPAALGTPVPSPMVGTVYLAPEPGKPPFVKKGDGVKEGDTLLIIEAMKVMNPIKAPVAGTIADILVGDGKPVEFGETLIIIS
ncbi:MAG: acetyl-CoA carboxylase biotin carboxyl carrier protein subunit [Bdellovibrionales bacterium]